MNRKRNITITLFTFSLVILVVLQGYYIYNSYRLQERDLTVQARAIADKTLDTMEKYETDTNEEKLVGDFQRLKTGITIQKEKITNPERIYNSEKLYNKKLEKILKENIGNTGFEIAMKSEIYSILDEVQKMELLPAGRSLVLYQTVKKMSKPLVINEGKWSSRQSKQNTDLKLDEKNYYLVKSKSTFQLLNVKILVLKKIIPLIIISLLIIVLIIILFRNSIKNLSRQEKKISQLHTTIDSIAHELNTPITTLKFSVAQSSDSETKALLERQIKRLENIVSSIHNNDSDDILIDKKEIENYFSEVKKSFNKIDFKIKLDFIENKSLYQNDFKQIMDNLIDNSSKYGAKEIEILIKINNAIGMEVSDDGIGIPKEEKQNIFDKYYRITRDENLHVNGLGVGLFLVKTIVDKYKGDIDVNPKKKGVSFKITIPNEA
ncbi:sensor histidine kinase [Epilithonimonas arachidiradicis]|uniref:histidine kinase n=1 Tax=Epilithonimonas arachidiradicis TaxID=1617282 RepID=A0A420CMC6_9FLAO|nr:HAMP domain-containing sensor histidine kinase [Epilithonimonas arachidiradicis]RKE79584.1 histidine kinase/DNA gyrase B/HSP90-like ATPase [Epilithonimonas arachidiradicis]GGG66329.1 two-component sensor histidine kinase [Epilithonimonas arachidiradicis]